RTPGRSALTGLGGDARELDPRADVELAVDVAQVRLDGARAEDELVGDLAVRSPGGDERGDLALAGGERRGGAGGRLAGPADDPVREAAQLARRLVAPAYRPETVERGLGGAKRVDGLASLSSGGERAPFGEARAGGDERRADRGRAGS